MNLNLLVFPHRPCDHRRTMPHLNHPVPGLQSRRCPWTHYSFIHLPITTSPKHVLPTHTQDHARCCGSKDECVKLSFLWNMKFTTGWDVDTELARTHEYPTRREACPDPHQFEDLLIFAPVHEGSPCCSGLPGGLLCLRLRGSWDELICIKEVLVLISIVCRYICS